MSLTRFLSSVCKVAGIVTISALLVSCGSKTQKNADNVSSGGEPAWVNDIGEAKKETNSLVVAVGSAKILDGNINFATNQAALQARAQIAQTVSAKVEQVIKELNQSDGLKISEASLQATKQKVSANLQQTEIAKKWVDKKSNPQMLYVLVTMDKDAYDRALRAGTESLDIDSSKAKKLSDTVEELLAQ